MNSGKSLPGKMETFPKVISSLIEEYAPKLVLLEIPFRIEGTKHKAFRVIREDRWELIQRVLTENKTFYFEFTHSDPPSEYIVGELRFGELLQKIKVEKDPVKIDAFQTAFGDSFYTGADYFEELFDQVDPFIRKMERKKKNEKKKKVYVSPDVLRSMAKEARIIYDHIDKYHWFDLTDRKSYEKRLVSEESLRDLGPYNFKFYEEKVTKILDDLNEILDGIKEHEKCDPLFPPVIEPTSFLQPIALRK